MAKMKWTKKEQERFWELHEIRMMFCDAGRWTRNSYHMCKEQAECENEIRKLRAKRDGKIWL